MTRETTVSSKSRSALVAAGLITLTRWPESARWAANASPQVPVDSTQA